jgi:RND family efflux transporter MFP subunit
MKRKYFPGIVDIVVVTDPAEIRTISNDSRLDRDYIKHGPVRNVQILRKMLRIFSLNGRVFPLLLPRTDPRRAAAHDELWLRLNGKAEEVKHGTAELDPLAEWVRGIGRADKLDLLVQQSIGRLFMETFTATEESLAAARMVLEAASSSNLLKMLSWRISGRLERAKTLLASLMNGDLTGVNAMITARQLIVDSLHKMRQLAADPARRSSITTDAAVDECLIAPTSVLRQAKTSGEVGGCPFRRGSLFILGLGSASKGAANRDLVFLSQSWSPCPAEKWVHALLAGVWSRSVASSFMKIIILAFSTLSLFSCSTTAPPPAVVESLPVIQISSGSATTYQEYPASIEGTDNVEIRPQVSGLLEKIFVDEGAFVKAGQPLFKIDEAPFREKLNKAIAALRAAQGTLANAQLEIERLTPLVAGKVIADFQLKTAITSREVALGSVEQAKADIASAGINLGYTLIKSPSNGFIGRLLRKRGSLVGSADPSALTELSDVHNVHVYFALGEFDFIQFKSQYAGRTLADKIKNLPPVELILANDSAYSLQGKIDLIDGQFDRNTGAITVRATFSNTDGLLRSGNTGKIKLGLMLANQLVVPQSATLELQDKSFVFVVNDSNRVGKRPILISGKTGINYLIKEGLKPGDRIVFRGFDHLHEGDKINPVTPKADSTRLAENN